MLEFVRQDDQDTYELVRLLTPLTDRSIKEIMADDTMVRAYRNGRFCEFCRSYYRCSKPEAVVARERETIRSILRFTASIVGGQQYQNQPEKEEDLKQQT